MTEWTECFDQVLITQVRLQLEGPFRLASVHFSYASPPEVARPYMDLVLVMDAPLSWLTGPGFVPAPVYNPTNRLHVTYPHNEHHTWSYYHKLMPGSEAWLERYVVMDPVQKTITDARGFRYRRNP